MSANARADRIPVSNPAEPRQIVPYGLEYTAGGDLGGSDPGDRDRQGMSAGNRDAGGGCERGEHVGRAEWAARTREAMRCGL